MNNGVMNNGVMNNGVMNNGGNPEIAGRGGREEGEEGDAPK